MNEIKKIMYNCQQATMLIEKKQLTRLTLREKLALKIHLAGCSVCKVFQRQSILINKQVRSLFQSGNEKPRVLSEAYKKILQEKIEQKLTR